MKNYLLLLLPLLLYAARLPAQQARIHGLVTDKATGSPLPAASVYVNNSTYNSAGDANGRFVFDRFPALPAELTISAVGYETGTLKVTAENAQQELKVSLNRKVVSLEEVQISGPEKDGWAKYGQRFLDEFVGKSEYAAACNLRNKEVLQFRFDPKEGILKAWADKPLVIRNTATGYDIIYWLDDFELDMFGKQLFYKGYAYFRELPASDRKARRMRERRRSAFNGSFAHFVRSLYKGNALAEGFEIRTLKRIPGDETGQYVPVKTDTLYWQEEARLDTLLSEVFAGDTAMTRKGLAVLKSWAADTSKQAPLRLKGMRVLKDKRLEPVYVFVKDEQLKGRGWMKYYETKNAAQTALTTEVPEVLNPAVDPPPGLVMNEGQRGFWLKKQVVNILYSKLLPEDSVVQRSGNDVVLRFPYCLQVTYTREPEEEAYLLHFADRERGLSQLGVQTSVLTLRNREGLHLLENGNFYEAYDLLLEQYWSYEKLDKLLPLDYDPARD